MENNNKNLNSNPEEEKKANIYDIELDEDLSPEVADTIESLKKVDSTSKTSDDNGSDSEAPKRKRGRPRKNKTNLEVTMEAEEADDEQDNDGQPIEDVALNETSSKIRGKVHEGKKVSSSVINLFLFAMIFAALVAAQFVLKMESKKDEGTSVEAVEITAEEDIDAKLTAEATDNEEIVAGDVEEDKVEIKAEAEGKTDTILSERKKVVVEDLAEDTPDQKKHYRGDPYTSGGPMDLDGSHARSTYWKPSSSQTKSYSKPLSYAEKKYSVRKYDADGNYLGKVVREEQSYSKTDMPKSEKSRSGDVADVCRTYEQRPYYSDLNHNYDKNSDRSNPWNSGGTQDLDYQPNLQRQITKRSNEY